MINWDEKRNISGGQPDNSEQEALRIMEEYRSGRQNAAGVHPGDTAHPAVVVPGQQAAPRRAVAPAQLASSAPGATVQPASAAAEEPAAETPQPPAPEEPVQKRPLKEVLLRLISNVIPRRGDGAMEIARKCVFTLALVVLVGSLGYIVNELVINPNVTQAEYDQLSSIHNSDNPIPVPDELKDKLDKDGIQPSLQYLYTQNQDLRGWLTYKASYSDFLRIDYPIMYSGDNDYYLNHDFHKTDNKHGALFFDERNDFETAESTNKVAIIYGHNMYDYSMFSNLNKFLVNRNYARQAATMTMETLFDTYEYKVFAVVLVNNDPADGPAFQLSAHHFLLRYRFSRLHRRNPCPLAVRLSCGRAGGR